MTQIFRTVLGDVPAENSGRHLTHEHLLYGYPGAEFDHRTRLLLRRGRRAVTSQIHSG